MEHRGFGVLAPDREYRAASWASEASHLAAVLPGAPVTVVAGSNGCSAAVRLAAQHAPDEVIEALLSGRTLRGVTDEELGGHGG